MEHTPIPWTVYRNGGHDGHEWGITAGARGCVSCQVAHEADAAFIVQAVNAHQALVEALEACRAQLTFLLATKPLGDDEFRGIYAEAVICAEAALKQARGEEDWAPTPHQDYVDGARSVQDAQT